MRSPSPFHRYILGDMLFLALVAGGSVLGGEIRGTTQDYRRARALTVAYYPGKRDVAIQAAKAAGFRVSRQDAKHHLFRCTWTNNEAASLQKKIDELSESTAVQLITPDPQRK